MIRTVAGSKKRTNVRWLLALLLAGLAVWLSVRQVRWSQLTALLAGARMSLLALALLAVLATTAVKAIRWHALLPAATPQVRLPRVLRVLFIGQMANTFLPRLGDIVRTILLGPRATGGMPAVLGTVLVEKALDGVMGLLVLAGLALWTPLPTWLRAPLLGLLALTAGLLLMVAWASVDRSRFDPLWHRLARRLPAPICGRIEQLVTSFLQGLGLFRSPSRALVALGLSSGIWILAMLTNVVVLSALKIEAPAWSAWLVVATGYAATFLPTVPAQIGVFEYAAVLSLQAADVAPEPALAFALVLHLLVQGPPAFLGPIFMAVEGLDWGKLRAAQREGMEGDGVLE
ncbi:MAG: flippase-like domain-containing protein [Anaerolineae bacterium]|nr:flippase-like domain-containing protein [Anaerolineae bacterium]